MRTITVSQALAVPSTNLPSCVIADEGRAWRSDAWATLRDMSRTGETAQQACGSDLLFWAAGVEQSRVVPG